MTTSMKRIAVFGATGGTGYEVVKQALARGYAVQALARTPSKLDLRDENLTTIQGDVLDAEVVGRVIQGTDAVIVSLGSTSNNPEFVVSQGTSVILDAMERQSVKRLLVVSSLGVGDSKDQIPFAFRILMKTVLRKAMADKERQEALVRAGATDWTIIRPGGLTDGPATGTYTAGTDPSITAGQVARADVAAFVLDQLETEQYLRQAVAIT